jgi:hypothetical protein
MWQNNSVYRGDLFKYHYPVDKEVGDFLDFLKHISSDKRIYLSDVPKYNAPMPPLDYDIYIICIFGEGMDDEFVQALDNNPAFADKHVIVLTSQFYKTKLKNIKMFRIEHIHTIIPFFPKCEYTQLKDRRFTHGLLSNRNALHKTVVLAKILEKFKDDVQYSFCNGASTEYSDPQTIRTVLENLGVAITDAEDLQIQNLHVNPVVVPGHVWDIDNHIYQNSKLIWTVESIFSSRDSHAYITEKSIKSIITGSAFVIVSQPQSMERLRMLGFETFESDFGIAFDSLNDSARYKEIFKLIDNFDHSIDNLQDKADYNHDYFYNKFHDYVKGVNKNAIEHAIEYINSL